MARVIDIDSVGAKMLHLHSITRETRILNTSFLWNRDRYESTDLIKAHDTDDTAKWLAAMRDRRQQQESVERVWPSDSREAEVCSCCCTHEGRAEGVCSEAWCESNSIGAVSQMEAVDTGGETTGCSRFSVYNVACGWL